jgi:hypothetical protein
MDASPTFAFRSKDQTAATVKTILTNLFTQLSAPNRIVIAAHTSTPTSGTRYQGQPTGSNTWYLRRDQWRPDAPLAELVALSVGDFKAASDFNVRCLQWMEHNKDKLEQKRRRNPFMANLNAG